MKNKFKLLFIVLMFFAQALFAQTWTQIGSDIDGEAELDLSGWSVSLSSDGKTVAIGAGDNDGNGDNAGHVRVYQNVNGSWTQIGSDIDGEAENDFSGYSVSLSSDGKTVAIGAPGNGSNGHVRVYQNVNGSWSQLGSDIDGEAYGDNSGNSVSLSSDGKTVAIGASDNGGNGDEAGHVRVYQNVNGSWTQIGSDINSEAEDGSGWSVSLSSDGKTVAIGAPFNDGNGDDAGHVRIYKLETGASAETIEAYKIHISPNPVADILTVNGIPQPVEFQITDLTGKEILTGKISNSNIDVSSLKVGIYFLKLENQSIQFVKE